MKAYTLTWRDSKSCTKTKLKRCRFWIGALQWCAPFGATPLEAFLRLTLLVSLGAQNGLRYRQSEFRLSSCGRLVARSATYQGV